MPATPLSITLQDVAIQLNDPCRITLFKPAEPLSKVSLPLFTSKIPAGFPSPANDYIEKNLDLNELMIQNPAATFFARAQGLIPTTNIGHIKKRVFSTIERYLHEHEIDWQQSQLYPA
jgi:hypothetical protein